MPTYTDMLAAYGVTAARPGGEKMTEYVFKKCPISGKNILEIGAGLGETANFISNNFSTKITAIEKNKKMFEKGKQKQSDNKNITWVHTDFLTYKPANVYDTVIIESVLSFTNISTSIKKISSFLKKNGKLYLLEPIYLGGLMNEELAEYKQFYGFVDIFTKEEWINALKTESFHIKKVISSTDIENGTEHAYPELVIDENLEEQYVSMLSKHIDLTNNYLAYFDYAYFICEKKENL